MIADPAGQCLFIDHEAWMIGCEIDDTPALFAGSDAHPTPRWLNAEGHQGIPRAFRCQITADSSRPDTISYMKGRGFRIVSAIKGKGSVEDGITFLKSYDIYVHPRCRHTIVELTHYSWKVDMQTGEILPILADANNHVIDALRYALEGARRAGSGRMEFASAGPRAALMGPGGRYMSLIPGEERFPRTRRGWGTVPGRSQSI